MKRNKAITSGWMFVFVSLCLSCVVFLRVHFRKACIALPLIALSVQLWSVSEFDITHCSFLQLILFVHVDVGCYLHLFYCTFAYLYPRTFHRGIWLFTSIVCTQDRDCPRSALTWNSLGAPSMNLVTASFIHVDQITTMFSDIFWKWKTRGTFNMDSLWDSTQTKHAQGKPYKHKKTKSSNQHEHACNTEHIPLQKVRHRNIFVAE